MTKEAACVHLDDVLFVFRLTVWEHGGHYYCSVGRVSSAETKHDAQDPVLGSSVFCLLPNGSSAHQRCEFSMILYVWYVFQCVRVLFVVFHLMRLVSLSS